MSRRAAIWDAALYGAGALWAAGVALWASIPLYREWGRLAVAPYAVGTLVAAAIAARWRGRPDPTVLRARAWLAIAVFAGAALVPLALEATWRARTGPGFHAQSEAIITEEAAKALLQGRDPYAETFHGPLAARPLGTRSHFPYLPAMLSFGFPRALDGESSAADARVSFALATVALTSFSLWLWRAPGDRRLRVAQVLAILPTGALAMAAGGDDLPVLALMLLSLVLVHQGKTGWAGAAAGLASSMKQTAWPLVPFLVLAAWKRGGRRGATRLLATSVGGALSVVLPFLAWNPSAFVEDVILFPLGLGQQGTAAGTTTIGTLLIGALPRAEEALTVCFVLVVAGVGAYLLVRRTASSAAQAALHAGTLFAVALVLAPVARLGYVIYPVNLLLWAAAFGRDGRATAEGSTRPGDVPLSSPG